MVTLAPGIAAPEGSVTVPEMPPKTAWAKLVAGQIAKKHPRTAFESALLIDPLPIPTAKVRADVLHADRSRRGRVSSIMEPSLHGDCMEGALAAEAA